MNGNKDFKDGFSFIFRLIRNNLGIRLRENRQEYLEIGKVPSTPANIPSFSAMGNDLYISCNGEVESTIKKAASRFSQFEECH